MERFYKKIIFLTLIILTGIALRFSGVANYFSFETLKENRELILATAQTHSTLAPLLYILIYILATASALPVAAPMTLIGGFLFGVVGSTVYTNIGATIGATILLLLFRYFLGNQVQERYHTQLATFNTNLDRYGTNYLLLARLVVFFPFFMINILAGLTRIPVTTFIWTTSLGIIPGTAMYAYVGKQIGSINSLAEVFSWQVIVAFGLLIGLGLFSLLAKIAINKRILK
jgi:uncharacterized membrane protein YdjX (TVP38/TMEM64 family)